jgi:hypothetical protein
MLIYKGEYQKLMEFSYVAEHNLLDFMITCIGETNYKAERNISVKKPFGRKETREKNIREGRGDTSVIKPEFCLVRESHGYVGEVAGAKDINPSGKEYSESHCRVWDLVKQSNSSQSVKTRIYFAQKIMCQIFPVYLYLKNEKKLEIIKCYCGAVEMHKDIMENTFKLLHKENLLSSFPTRPLNYMDFDIKKYGLVIYEIEFHEDLLDQTQMKNKLDIDLNAQTASRDARNTARP